MPEVIWIPLVVVWFAWCTQAVLAGFLNGKFYRRLYHPRRQAFLDYRPTAVVIIPFKGLEPALDEHLEALLEQDYPDYRLLLVVESPDDAAYPVLRAFTDRHPGRVELIESGVAGPDEGQKVHNHLAALDHLEQAGRDEGVWVFADSDAVPGPRWLGDLVGPLTQEKTGVSTGYRWLIPSPESPEKQGKITFWSHCGSILNASAAGFAGREEQNHAWGGSMALRAETARQLDLRGWLKGSLSDDYQVTRMVRAQGLRIYFVMRCLVSSPAHFTRRSLAEFARRQYLITRIHAPGVFFGGLGVLGLYQLGFWSALAALAYGWITTQGDLTSGDVALPGTALLAVIIADHVRATIRHLMIRKAFGKESTRRMRMTLLIDRFLTPVWMTLNFTLLFGALFGRTITWRGNTYRMNAPQDIQQR